MKDSCCFCLRLLLCHLSFRIIIVIMAIEVHERLLLLLPLPSAVPPLFQRFFLLSTTTTTTQQGSSSFLNRSFAIKKGGFFSFAQLSRSLANTVFFFFLWFSGSFLQLGDFFSENGKALFIYFFRIFENFSLF